MKFIYQQGGTVNPPFAVYQYNRQAAAQRTAASGKPKSDKESDDLGMKDVVELLGKMKGLPGDIAVAQGRVNQLVKRIEAKLQAPDVYGQTSSIASEYMELLNLVGTINQHNSYYEEAKKNAIAKNSLNEVAIDSMGRIKVYNKINKQYEWVTIQEYEEDTELYKPVTNAELLDSRFNGIAGLAFDTETVTAISDGVSLKSITDKINAQLQGLESNQLTTTGYVSSQNREVLKGIQTFKEAIKSSSGPNIFAEKTISKDQASQISYAFSYIYANLTTKEKALLEFNSRNIEGGVMGLLSQLIASKQSVSYEYTPIDQDPTKKGGSKEGNDVIDEFKLGPADLLEAGYARNQNIIIQTPESKKSALRLTAVKLPLVDSNNNSLGASTTLDKVLASPYTGILDKGNISMGGAFIHPEAAINVAINGGDIYAGYLPVTYTDDGRIKPNLALLENYQKALEEIKKQGIDMEKEPAKANKIFQDNKLPVMYNNKGEVNVTKYHKFVMLNGVALNRAFSENVALEEWLTEMNDTNEKLNNLVTIGKAHGEQIDFDHKSWADGWMPFWNSHDSMYRGTIFIPTEYNVFTSAVGRGESLSTEEAERLHAIQQNEDAAKGIVSTGLL